MKPARPAVSRSAQAAKISAILTDFLGEAIFEASCLDIGCSDGAISQRLAGCCKAIVGIDVDQLAVRAGARENPLKNGAYTIASGFHLPFESGRFDVAICAQVYEHVADQPALASEVWRVLRPGGVCFFSGPNRLAFMEEHYWLPLLSWLPRAVAHRYMRAFRRGKFYDAYPLFTWQVRRLWQAFTIHDYTARLLREPGRFAMNGRIGKAAWLGRLPEPLLRAMATLTPNYNWILVKPA